MTFKEFLSFQSVKPTISALKSSLPTGIKTNFAPKNSALVEPKAITPSLVSVDKKRSWNTNFKNRFKIRSGSGLDTSSF